MLSYSRPQWRLRLLGKMQGWAQQKYRANSPIFIWEWDWAWVWLSKLCVWETENFQFHCKRLPWLMLGKEEFSLFTSLQRVCFFKVKRAHFPVYCGPPVTLSHYHLPKESFSHHVSLRIILEVNCTFQIYILGPLSSLMRVISGCLSVAIQPWWCCILQTTGVIPWSYSGLAFPSNFHPKFCSRTCF